MKNITILTVLMLVACTPAAVGESQEIVRACNERMKDSAGLCECLGQQSLKDLNSDERAAVVLMLEKEEAQSSLMSKYPMPVIAGAGKFLGAAMATCTAEMMK
jgi:hypothetical protein